MNLAATMSLQNQGFLNPLASVQKAISGLLGALGLVGVSFAAFKSFAGFTEKLKGIFELGKELKTISMVTGESVSSIVILRKAFDEAGVGADAVEMSLVRMQKSLGGMNEEGEPTAKVFERLGINLGQVQKMGAVEQFDVLSKAIGGLGSESEKTKAVLDIFGRAGARMKALFGDPEAIESAQKSMAKFGGIMEKNADLFKKITNSLESLGAKVKGFFAGFADALGPVLLPLLEKLQNFSLIGIGQQAGAAASGFVKGIQDAITLIQGLMQDGTFWEAAGLQLKLGFVDAMDFLNTKFEQLVDALAEGLNGAVGNAGTALMNAFMGVAIQFSATIQEKLAELLGSVSLFGHNLISPEDTRSSIAVAQKEKQQGAALTEGALPTLVKGAFKDLAKGMGTDTDTARSRLAELKEHALAGMDLPLNGGLGDPTKPGRGGGAEIGGDFKSKLTEGDRLAKIGGFIGGGGGPALDYARRTVAEVVKLNSQTLQLIKAVQGMTVGLPPGWA